MSASLLDGAADVDLIDAADAFLNDESDPFESLFADDTAEEANALSSNDEFLAQVMVLTNQVRSENGLELLTFNAKLQATAQLQSVNMAEQDFFSHTGQDGLMAWDRAVNEGYDYQTVGENIGAGQRTPEEIVQGWVNSPGHLANILNARFTEIGVGYHYLENDTGLVNYNHYWTQVFGTEFPSAANDLVVETVEDNQQEETTSPPPAAAELEPAEVDLPSFEVESPVRGDNTPVNDSDALESPSSPPHLEFEPAPEHLPPSPADAEPDIDSPAPPINDIEPVQPPSMPEQVEVEPAPEDSPPPSVDVELNVDSPELPENDTEPVEPLSLHEQPEVEPAPVDVPPPLGNVELNVDSPAPPVDDIEPVEQSSTPEKVEVELGPVDVLPPSVDLEPSVDHPGPPVNDTEPTTAPVETQTPTVEKPLTTRDARPAPASVPPETTDSLELQIPAEADTVKPPQKDASPASTIPTLVKEPVVPPSKPLATEIVAPTPDRSVEMIGKRPAEIVPADDSKRLAPVPKSSAVIKPKLADVAEVNFFRPGSQDQLSAMGRSLRAENIFQTTAVRLSTLSPVQDHFGGFLQSEHFASHALNDWRMKDTDATDDDHDTQLNSSSKLGADIVL